MLNNKRITYHVYKRPFVDYFLRKVRLDSLSSVFVHMADLTAKVSAWYTLVIFTASVQEYADPVIDWLDAGRGIIGKRFFREVSCAVAHHEYTTPDVYFH
jgi:CTD nuclear envelope phosphatase 1